MHWKRFSTGATQTQIERFESSLQVALPADYKQYLLSVNGGHTINSVTFWVPEANQPVMLGCLYVLGAPGTGIGLEAVSEMLEDQVPNGFVAIGDDPGGNLILIRVTDGETERRSWHTGEIVFSDRVGFFFKQFHKRLFYVAPGIGSFLESLVPMSTET